MNKRVLKADMDQVLGSRVSDIMTILDTKPAFAEFNSLKAESDGCLAGIRSELVRLGHTVTDVRNELSERATVSEVSQALQTKADVLEVEAALACKVRLLIN